MQIMLLFGQLYSPLSGKMQVKLLFGQLYSPQNYGQAFAGEDRFDFEILPRGRISKASAPLGTLISATVKAL